MPVLRLECDGCGARSEELVLAAPVPRCACGAERKVRPAPFKTSIPPWMTDEGIARTARMREYLASPEAKGKDLERYDDAEPVRDEPQPETAEQVFSRWVAGGAKRPEDVRDEIESLGLSVGPKPSEEPVPEFA